MARKVYQVIQQQTIQGEGQVYTQQDRLLDQGGGESGECLEDELGLFGESAGQTATQCRPHNDPKSRICI